MLVCSLEDEVRQLGIHFWYNVLDGLARQMAKRDMRSRYLRAFSSFSRDYSIFTRLMPLQLEDNLSKAILSYEEG